MAKKFTAVTLDERLPGIHGLAPETPAKEVPRAKVPACNYSVEAGWTVEARKNCIGLRAECSRRGLSIDVPKLQRRDKKKVKKMADLKFTK